MFAVLFTGRAACRARAQGSWRHAEPGRAVRAPQPRGGRRRLGQPRGAGGRPGAGDRRRCPTGRARSSPTTIRRTSRSTSRSIPIAAASTAASTATPAPATAISGCRPGSTSRPRSSSSTRRRRCCGRSWRGRAMSASRSRWAPTPTPTSRWSGGCGSRGRCSRCWPRRATRSASSPSRPWSPATSTCWRRWRARAWRGSTSRSPRSTAEIARTLEPRASAPHRRLAAIRALAAAGVTTGVMVAPIIPALTDHEIEPILAAAADGRVRSAPATSWSGCRTR